MELILTSIIAFATTNIDDLFILTLFFADRKYKPREIYKGQFLGIASLITVSLLISLLGLIIQPAYIGLLGLIPVYIGFRKLFNLFSSPDKVEETAVKTSPGTSNVLSVAAVTFANGGDNIGIYVPLFATLSFIEKSVMTIIFLAMTALWCFAAQYFTKHPLLKKSVDRYGHIIAPMVLILLGFYILHDSGTINLFTN